MPRYPIKLTPDADSSLLVTSPDFPELTSFGDTQEDAAHHAADALAAAIAARLHDGAAIPSPSAGGDILVDLPLHLRMILWLVWTLEDLRWTRSDLQRELGWPREEIKRLFDPHHAGPVERFREPFRMLGRQLSRGDLTDAAEARIQRGIAADPDNPEWTEEDFAQARRFAEVFSELAAKIGGKKDST